MGMQSIFLGNDKRWWYATLDESGKNSCRHIIPDKKLEAEFLVFLDETAGDTPDSYNIFELNRFYEKFMRLRSVNGNPTK